MFYSAIFTVFVIILFSYCRKLLQMQNFVKWPHPEIEEKPDIMFMIHEHHDQWWTILSALCISIWDFEGIEEGYCLLESIGNSDESNQIKTTQAMGWCSWSDEGWSTLARGELLQWRFRTWLFFSPDNILLFYLEASMAWIYIYCLFGFILCTLLNHIVGIVTNNWMIRM